MDTLTFEYGNKTIREFSSLFKDGQLNLEPGFQRKSVWSLVDRKKLVESIALNLPIPSIFLYQSADDEGRLKYDVIDGKQRLETILMFQSIGKYRKGRFETRFRFSPDEEITTWDWKSIQREGKEHRITGYKIQTVEVSGSLSEIINLFVRINSTGKRLTGAEKRNARFFNSPFLVEASKLADRYTYFLLENQIVSRSQLGRMKHVELVCELLASISAGGLINKKTALDKIIAGQSVEGKALRKCASEFVHTLHILERMFPEIKSTRFKNTADFYSLYMFVWQLNADDKILGIRDRNHQAQVLLKWLSNGVDQVRIQQRKAEGALPDQRIFADYLLTVQGDSDSLATRQRREKIFTNVLGGLFEPKDHNRGFTTEQRRLIWNSEDQKSCPACGEVLSWENFTIDHIKPHSLGGKSELSNATLMCRSCNSKKGTKQNTART